MVLFDRAAGADRSGAAFERRAVHAHAFDPIEIERKARIALVAGGVALSVDDLETHISSISAGMRRFNFSAPYFATSLVWVWEMTS